MSEPTTSEKLQAQAIKHNADNKNHYATHPSAFLRQTLATYTKNPELLHILAQDQNSMVRHHTTTNKHTATPTINILIEDPSHQTAAQAATHPAANKTTATQAINRADNNPEYAKILQELLAILAHRNTKRTAQPALVAWAIDRTQTTSNIEGYLKEADNPTVAAALARLLERLGAGDAAAYANKILIHTDATYPPLVTAIKNTITNTEQKSQRTLYIEWWANLGDNNPPKETQSYIHRIAENTRNPQYLDRLSKTTITSPTFIGTILNNPCIDNKTQTHILESAAPNTLVTIGNLAAPTDTRTIKALTTVINRLVESDNDHTCLLLDKLAEKHPETISTIIHNINKHPKHRTTQLIKQLAYRGTLEDAWNLPPVAWRTLDTETADALCTRLQNECGQTGATIAYGLADEWENTTSALAETALALAQNQTLTNKTETAP